MQRGAAIVILAAMAWLGTGCADPYSQRRIALRREGAHFVTESIARGEEHRREFRQRTKRDLEKWWRSDQERLNRRLTTLGDYIW